MRIDVHAHYYPAALYGLTWILASRFQGTILDQNAARLLGLAGGD
jgi:hypothetical protein